MTLSDYDAARDHKYRVVHNGPAVPGVTTAINAVADKGGMVYAAAKIAAESLIAKPQRRKKWIAEYRAKLQSTRGNSQWAIEKRNLGIAGTDDEILVMWARDQHRVQWDAKAARGDRVHAVAEQWTRGEPGEIPEGEEGYVDALESFFTFCRPDIEAAEKIVLNPDATLPYGGRFDFVGRIDDPITGRQITALCDYKTGGEYPMNCAMQAAAYMGAFYARYNSDGSLGPLGPLVSSNCHNARTIYLREDGTFKVSDPFATISFDDARLAFKSALTIFNIRKAQESAAKESA